MVTPSQAFGGLEWAVDTGAGRHLVSYEALQEQGYHRSLFSGFANDSNEKLNFSTGGGFRKSSDTTGFQDQDGLFGDAKHFLLDSCPVVRSIGLDVKQNGLGFIWLPGSLPFLVRDPSPSQLRRGEQFLRIKSHSKCPIFQKQFYCYDWYACRTFSRI